MMQVQRTRRLLGRGSEDFDRIYSLFERDQLMPQQWADLYSTPRQTPIMDLCQVLVQDALYQLAKGPAYPWFEQTKAWVTDVTGEGLIGRTRGEFSYPIPFERAIHVGYPTLAVTPEVLSARVLKSCAQWTKATAPMRAWHLVPRFIHRGGDTAARKVVCYD